MFSQEWVGSGVGGESGKSEGGRGAGEVSGEVQLSRPRGTKMLGGWPVQRKKGVVSFRTVNRGLEGLGASSVFQC